MSGTSKEQVEVDVTGAMHKINALETRMAKSRKWVEALGTALIALFIILVITVATVCTNSGERDRQEQEKLAPLKAQLEECREEHGAMLATLNKYAVESTPCPTCQECPPAPVCNEEPLNECRRELNWREQKIAFGEWFDQMQNQTEEKIATLRTKYFELWEQMLPVKARAEQLGIGPRVREWINTPGAAETYLELGSRWGEIEYTHSLITQEIQQANQRMEMTCYQNIEWSWGELVPDDRDYERMRSSIYDLVTDYGAMHLFVRELAKREGEQP